MLKEQPSAVELSYLLLLINLKSGDEMTGDQMSGDEMTGDEMSGDEMTGDEMSGDEMSVHPILEPYQFSSQFCFSKKTGSKMSMALKNWL